MRSPEQGWSTASLGQLCAQFKEINAAGADLPPLSVTKDVGVVLQSEKFNKRIATDVTRYKICRHGDFVYDPMSLYYGAIGWQRRVPAGLVSPAYITFRLREGIDPSYFWFLVKSPRMQAAFTRATQGGNQHGKRKKTDWESFSGLEVAVPPLNEQRRIAAVLGAVDDAVSKTESVIAQTKEVRWAVMTQLLTQGLPGRHTEFQDTESGRMPTMWRLELLGSVAERGSGHTPDKKHPEYWGGSIKWLSLKDCSHLDRLYISDTAAKTTPLGIANSSAVEHPVGTVVLSRDAGVGKSAITTDVMAVSQHFMAWKCGPLLDNHFLYYWLQARKPEFERIAVGSTIKTIGLPYFKSLKIPVPPMPEQRAIAACLKDMDFRLFAEEATLDELKAVKRALLDALLAGQSGAPNTTGAAA